MENNGKCGDLMTVKRLPNDAIIEAFEKISHLKKSRHFQHQCTIEFYSIFIRRNFGLIYKI